MGFILAIIIGGIAGYIASYFMKTNSGLIMNIALGVAGAFIVNLLIGLFFGLWGGNIIWNLLAGIIGASGLIWGYRKYQDRK